MPITVSLGVGDHAVGWVMNFYMLAVRRTEPLWSLAGIPTRNVGDVAAVRVAALDALERDYEAALPESVGGNLALWLTRFFQQVEAAYGEETAQELFEWMQRNVGDQRRAWWEWNFLLPELAGQRGPDRPRVAPPWEAAKVQRFQAAVEEEFNDVVWNQEHILVTAAERIELSPAEIELLTVNGADDGPLDVMDMVRAAASVHRVYRVFRSMETWFSAADWVELLNWGRANAPIAILPMPAANISLPKPFDAYLSHERVRALDPEEHDG
jgi:hypothetical protein